MKGKIHAIDSCNPVVRRSVFLKRDLCPILLRGFEFLLHDASGISKLLPTIVQHMLSIPGVLRAADGLLCPSGWDPHGGLPSFCLYDGRNLLFELLFHILL